MTTVNNLPFLLLIHISLLQQWNILIWPHWIQNLLKISPKEIENMTDLEKKEVLLKIINHFVNSMVLQKVQENFENQSTSHGNSSIPTIVCLPDGSRINLLVPIATNQIKSSHVTSTSDLDGVKMYGSCVLELGFLYKSVLQNLKIPNRDRFIPLLKYLMCVLKGHSDNSKYALEILRFLCHQLQH